MDTTVLLGAVSTLFTLYSGFLLNENRNLKNTIEELEKENKKYASIIVSAAETAEGVQGMRSELARFLRGD